MSHDGALSPQFVAARDAAVEFLLGRINYEKSPALPYDQRQLKLDRMRTLLAHLGHPDRGMPIVHIAGTKGKGSVAAFTASILREAGYDVGVYSSPHLEFLEERFTVNGQLCPPGELVALVDELRPAVMQMDAEAAATGDRSLRPTFFELTTALALLLFRRRRVDITVLEVGLGGRLDSTNVCQPVLTAISSIGYDHTKQLGETLPEIAREKAGIVKPGVPLVLGPLAAEPYEAIAEIARTRGARIVATPRDYCFRYDGPAAQEPWHAPGRLTYDRPAAASFALEGTPLGLRGAHQAANAAVAVTIVSELCEQGWLVSHDALRRGIAATRLPGRIEIVREAPLVVLDVAHNVASAAALAEFLRRSPVQRSRRLLFAATRDKDVRGIIRELAPCFEQAWLTEYHEAARSVPAAELASLWDEATAGIPAPAQVAAVVPDAEAAWRAAAANLPPDGLIAATGSFFLIAELRPLVTGRLPSEAPSA
ncbi:MAG: bifunctional folylpolyglutamate synthase/dihydrofolate synthase [Planctomycetales bacterium]|nr:bifunctional folylpolyglutamate synthase/dihydrofolate synthase [Planctomycetales bacterium]